jgi:hypothetical protein
VLAGSSNWVPGSWVLNFQKKIQNLKLEMGTSQQPEPKLGTGLQLEQDLEPELTPKLIACNFWFLIFLIQNSSLKLVFFPFLTWVRHVISFVKKLGFGIITAPIY